MSKFSRDKYREGINERILDSYNRKDDSGRFGDIFKLGIPIPKWKCKEGEHIIDILPYISGKNNPHVEKGSPTYVLDLWIHYSVGINEDAVICPARTFKEKCPICEMITKLRRESDEENDNLISLLTPSRRTLYNILVYDTPKEEDLGVQVWEVAFWNIERHLTSLAKDPRGGGFILFADPDEGVSLSFTRQGTTKTDTSFLGHKFIKRDYKISDEILESTFCLDEIIEIKSYEEINNLFKGEDLDSRSEKLEKESEKKKDKELEKNEEKKSSSVRQRRRERQQPREEKEEILECPGNGIFGKDIDLLDKCDDCKIWDDCAKKADEMEKEDKIG